MPVFNVQPSGRVTGFYVPGEVALQSAGDEARFLRETNTSCDQWPLLFQQQKRDLVIGWLSHTVSGNFGDTNIQSTIQRVDALCSRRPPSSQPTSAACASLNDALDKPIEGTIRVDFGPSTTYIQFRNPTVTLRRWSGLRSSEGTYGRTEWQNTKQQAILDYLDASQLDALRRNADWQSQAWARLFPVGGEIIAAGLSAANRSILVSDTPGWYVADAISTLEAMAKNLNEQLVNAGCQTPAASNVPAAVSTAEDPAAMLARLNISCAKWSSMLRPQQMEMLAGFLYPASPNPYGDMPGGSATPLFAALTTAQQRRVTDLITQINLYCVTPAAQPAAPAAPAAPTTTTEDSAAILDKMQVPCSKWSSLPRPRQMEALAGFLYPSAAGAIHPPDIYPPAIYPPALRHGPESEIPLFTALTVAQQRRVTDLITQMNLYCVRQASAMQAATMQAPTMRTAPPTKAAGAVTTAGVMPWVGGMAVGALLTYAAVCVMRKKR